MLNKMFL
jgi:hypothetical protein